MLRARSGRRTLMAAVVGFLAAACAPATAPAPAAPAPEARPAPIEPLAGQVRSIGVDMVLDGRTSPDALKSINEGNYEIAMEFTASLDFRRQMNFLHSRSPQNKMGLRDQRLDELLDTQLTVLDVEQRKAAAREMQRLLEEKMYVIPTMAHHRSS